VSTPDDDSLEAKLRAIAEEVSRSLEHAFEQIDLNEITEEIGGSIQHAVEELDLGEISERLGIGGDRGREFADLATQWLSQQFGTSASPWAPQRSEDPLEGNESPPRRRGPHPLDVPTEEQGLALSALDSGRWRVDPGTEELIPVGGGPNPAQPVGLVGELRARDWIAPSGQVTLVGRDALSRWLSRPHPS
jgi:hypothetical protein